MKKLIILCSVLTILSGSVQEAQAQSTCPTYRQFLPLIQNSYNPYPGPNMPILSGVQRTPNQILSNLPPPITQPWEEKYFIVQVDYVAKTMMLSIRGSAAQWIPVLPSIASTMGTLQAPNVVPQNWARVQRIKNRYWIVGWDKDPNSFGAGVVGSALPAPLNWNIYQRGASLNGTWSAVPGAIAYEVWQNLSNSPTGATLAPGGRVGNALSYFYDLSAGQSSNLITVNCDFERGTLEGWRSFQPVGGIPAIVTTADKHGGNYSAFIDGNVPSSITGLAETIRIPVQPSTSYFGSAWIRTPLFSGVGAEVRIFIVFEVTDINGAFTNRGYGFVVDSLVSVPSWTQFSATFTSPAFIAGDSNMTAHYEIDVFTGANEVSAYVDDFYFSGVQGLSSLFYAPRALGSFSGQVSPFASWQQPVQQSLSIGNPATSAKLNPVSGNVETYKGDDIKVGATAARVFSYLTFR